MRGAMSKQGLAAALWWAVALAVVGQGAAFASEAELPLFWEYATPYYRVVLSLDPVAFDSLAVDPTGRAEYREVLAYSGKPTTLWVGIGGWGTHSPGPAGGVETRETPLGAELVVRRIPLVGILLHNLGDLAPLTADWAFRFGARCFEFQVTWHVQEQVRGLQEAGWAFNLDLAHYGDAERMPREPGDVRGFPAWIAWYDDDVAVVAVYQGGAGPLEANRWYGSHETAYVIVHNWWRPGGVDVDWGSYPGGWWRIVPVEAGDWMQAGSPPPVLDCGSR